MQSLIINQDDTKICKKLKESASSILKNIKETNFQSFAYRCQFNWFLVDNNLIAYSTNNFKAITLDLITLNTTLHKTENWWNYKQNAEAVRMLMYHIDANATLESKSVMRISDEFYVVNSVKDMVIDKDGNVIQTSAKWEHKVLDLPKVNSWIKTNLPFISDMRKVAKMLGTDSKFKDVEVSSTDIESALGTDLEKKAIAEERIAYGKSIKPAVALYMQSVGLDPYIITYFDKYSELHQHRARKTKE